MWPVIFQIGPVKLYSFGLMAALAMLGGSYLLKLEMDRNHLGEGRWNNYAIAALLGGFGGAKLNFLLTHAELLREDFFHSVFSGAGLVWYGGLIGGTVCVLLLARHYRHPLALVADLFAPALTIAYMIGRVGCFVSGDGDYGKPSSVPWAMAFPNGIVPTTDRVHPTPIYEILMTAPILWILWKTRKRPWAPLSHIGLYLLLSGVERFIVEFWRRNPPGAFGLTTPQQFSVVAILCGLVLFLRRHRGRPAMPETPAASI